MAPAAEMMQKAANAVGTTLSSIMTLSMPSKTLWISKEMEHYEAWLARQGAKSTTMHRHSNLEHIINSSSRWPTPCCTNFNLLDIAYQAAESTDGAVSTTSRATLMPSGVMGLCKSNSTKPMVSAIAPATV
jgi:hypothetical protein